MVEGDLPSLRALAARESVYYQAVLHESGDWHRSGASQLNQAPTKRHDIYRRAVDEDRSKISIVQAAEERGAGRNRATTNTGLRNGEQKGVGE
jgi:hypothetical protein